MSKSDKRQRRQTYPPLGGQRDAIWRPTGQLDPGATTLAAARAAAVAAAVTKIKRAKTALPKPLQP